MNKNTLKKRSASKRRKRIASQKQKKNSIKEFLQRMNDILAPEPVFMNKEMQEF
jgi:hypothetical protein